MNEIISGINVLKLYAWENSFKKKIVDIRNEELVKFEKNGLIFAGIHFFFCTIPYLVSIVVYYLFINQGGYFDPAKAYLTVALFDNMNGTFTFLPLHMPSFYQGWQSLKKVNKFLNIAEIPEDVTTVDSSAPMAVSVKNGDFTWDTKSCRSGLQNISMDIPDGSLVAVVGRVGSGKSSLLSAVLGEMEKVKGEVTVNGSIAYVPQEAWILNATFEDNILFQPKKDCKRYNQVVDACSLRTDLELQKRGDQTLIGERGVNLSGGQKQRVSTARAVYNDADIYLLDDPLSAVDAHVGKHIFHSVIGHTGLLQGKTRLLVTHGVHWLPFVDRIIVMKEGRISESGTFKQLLSYDGDLAKYLNEVFDRKDIPDADSGVNLIRGKIFRRLSSLNENENQEVSSEDEGQLMEGGSEGEDNTDSKPLLVELEHETNTDTNSANIDDDDEDTEESVEPSRRVYIDYIKSMGVGYFILCLSLICGDYVSEKCKNLAMSAWGDDPYLANRSLVDTPEYAEISMDHFKKYALLGLSEMVISFFFVVLFFQRGVAAARGHHDNLLTSILRSPMSFFDTNPTGRIINRFSKDITCVDNLPHFFRGYLHLMVQVVSNFIMVIALNPRVIPSLLVIGAVYFSVLRLSVAYFRPIARFQKKSTSPLYTHISETLNGTDSIRAYKAQERVISKMQRCLEKVMRYELTELWVHDWTNIRWSLLSALMALTALLSLMWNRDVTPGQATVLLACITGVIRSLGHFVVHSAYVDTEMVSLERVIDYSSKPTEAAWELPESHPHPNWPLDGSIELDDYKTRYRQGLDLVLKGITCKISSGEKVGIVGRTGAGKSSLTVALFRLIESAGGRILVNNEPIAPLGLHDLRNKITILPQSPVIFGGSLRMNLDPLGVRTSEDLWDALKHSHLQDFVEGLPQKLEYDCGEGGKNLSTGQKQLICLARALLRKTNILVLDEATAGVDMETDELIQKTIREEFKDCTVLTIAHRLNTVMDYDRIMVLESGTIKEFDSPKKLLADPKSEFYSMAKDAKIVS